MRRTLAALLLAALALTGCGSGDPEAAPSPSPEIPPELRSTVAETVVRVQDPGPVVGIESAGIDGTNAGIVAASTGAEIEAAARAVIEGGVATLPGDPTLTAGAIDLLAVLVRPEDPVVNLTVTPVADAGPGGDIITVTLDAATFAGEGFSFDLVFVVGPDGTAILQVAENTRAPDTAPTPEATGTDAPGDGGTTSDPTEEAS